MIKRFTLYHPIGGKYFENAPIYKKDIEENLLWNDYSITESYITGTTNGGYSSYVCTISDSDGKVAFSFWVRAAPGFETTHTLIADCDNGFFMLVNPKIVYNTNTFYTSSTAFVSTGTPSLGEYVRSLGYKIGDTWYRTDMSEVGAEVISKYFNIPWGIDSMFTSTPKYIIYPAIDFVKNKPIPNTYICGSRMAKPGDKITNGEDEFECLGGGVFWYKIS